MQKKIIALALAAVAGSAAAQTNVQIYGVADMAVLHTTASGQSSVNNVSSGGLAGSRIGFKGTEDLGNGLKALFTLEYALAMDNNTGVGTADAPWSSTVARQQFVGLTSSYGTVVAGRLQTAGYDFACAYNPLAGGAFATNDKLAASTLLTCGSTGRANNALAYISPSFGGVTVALNYAQLTENANNQVDPKKDNNAYLASVSYNNGPIAATGIYTRINANQTAASDDTREYGLGASYDFKVAKVYAMYQNQKVQNQNSDKKWQLGVAVPVTAAGTVMASYADSTIGSTAASDNTKAYSLAYVHALSKRTKVYAGYNHVNNDGVATRSFTNGSSANFVTPTAGGSATGYGFGVNHAF